MVSFALQLRFLKVDDWQGFRDCVSVLDTFNKHQLALIICDCAQIDLDACLMHPDPSLLRALMCKGLQAGNIKTTRNIGALQYLIDMIVESSEEDAILALGRFMEICSLMESQQSGNSSFLQGVQLHLVTRMQTCDFEVVGDSGFRTPIAPLKTRQNLHKAFDWLRSTQHVITKRFV